MIKITERDKNFLLMLNETGACYSKMLFKFYSKRYARTRVEKMEIEKIVTRKYGLIMIGIEGKIYLESIGVVPKILDTMPILMQRRLARVMELKNLLPNIDIDSSANYKKKKKLNRGMQFVAVGTLDNSKDYLIYDVPRKISTETKTQILKELRNKKDVINNAIVFTRNYDFVQILSANNVYISELLLIPPTTFYINLINAMGEGNFDRRVIGAAFPELIDNKMFNEKQTKYMLGNNTYINLVLNNISAIALLSSMDIFAIVNNTSSNHTYNVVCLHSQEDFIANTIENLNLKKLNVVIKTIAPGKTSFY